MVLVTYITMKINDITMTMKSMMFSWRTYVLTNDIASKMTGSIIPLVVPTNHQSTAFITPVVIGLSWQPVVVVPL